MEAKGLLQVITDCAYALTTLDRFDHATLTIEEVTRPAPFIMTYEAAMEIVKAMGTEFGGLFGQEKDQGFKSALGAVYQTYGDEDLYPSIEEKAANLRYFVVKNHAFSDGNSVLPQPCSSLFWPATNRFTAKMAPSGLPTTHWWPSR